MLQFLSFFVVYVQDVFVCLFLWKNCMCRGGVFFVCLFFLFFLGGVYFQILFRSFLLLLKLPFFYFYLFYFCFIYTNKIGDCLFIYLFVYLSICSAMGGQTARPNGLKFGG